MLSYVARSPELSEEKRKAWTSIIRNATRGDTLAVMKPDGRAPLPRLVLAGLLTGVTDGLFASVQSVFFFHSTVTRLWQGVAAVPLGPSALEGGTRTVLIGLLLHFCTAFFWSAVFFFLYNRSARIREAVQSRFGSLKVASVYGPLIWIFMSVVVIPLFLHRPPAFRPRWFAQLIGHIFFVGLPIVSMIGRGFRGSRQEA